MVGQRFWSLTVALWTVGSGSSCSESSDPAPITYCGRTEDFRIYEGTTQETFLGLTGRQHHAIGLLVPEWAWTGEGRPAGCTGTMIAAGWVLTAAHCSPPVGTSVAFSVFDTLDREISTWWSRNIIEHETLDLMLVELDVHPGEIEAVLDPIALADAVTPEIGSLLALAGLGETELATRGSRRFAVEPIVEANGDELTVDGQQRTGACSGDSGGPALMRAEDGTVRVLGVLSRGSTDCRGRDHYVQVSGDDPFFAASVPPHCLAVDCGGIEPEGRCYGASAVWCDGARIQGQACAGGQECGWSEREQGYRCVSAGVSSCPNVDARGRCSGDVVVRCEGGVLSAHDCGDEARVCALDSAGRPGCH